MLAIPAFRSLKYIINVVIYYFNDLNAFIFLYRRSMEEAVELGRKAVKKHTGTRNVEKS